MTVDPDAYCYGRKLLDRVGWEMFLGDDGHGGERWEPITGVRIAGDRVLLTIADGTTYVTGYTDAVRCRRPDRLKPDPGCGRRARSRWAGRGRTHRAGASPRQRISIARSSVTGAAGMVAAA
jgi:hypothetical protein